MLDHFLLQRMDVSHAIMLALSAMPKSIYLHSLPSPSNKAGQAVHISDKYSVTNKTKIYYYAVHNFCHKYFLLHFIRQTLRIVLRLKHTFYYFETVNAMKEVSLNYFFQR